MYRPSPPCSGVSLRLSLTVPCVPVTAEVASRPRPGAQPVSLKNSTGVESDDSSREIYPNRLYTLPEVARLLKLRDRTVRRIALRWVRHEGVDSRTILTTGDELLRYVRKSLAPLDDRPKRRTDG